MERVLQKYPTLKLCIPHLGAAEYEHYYKLVEKYPLPVLQIVLSATTSIYPNLYLDTTMILADWFDNGNAMNPSVDSLKQFLTKFPHRVMYGSDFPSILQ